MGVILRYKDFLQTYKTRGHRIKHLEEYKPLFPIMASETLAGIIADLICDGNMQTGEDRWRIDFTSKSIKELKRFESEVYKLFNKKGRIRKCTTNRLGLTYSIAVNCSPITRILYLCGSPSGQKVLVPFNIPAWIKENKKYFRRFVQRAFTCEGGIMFEKHRKFPQIRMEMWKNKEILNNGSIFFLELQKYLKKYFDIGSTITYPNKENKRKDGIITKPIRMYILNINVVRFYNKIGFEGKKQKVLKMHLPD